MAIKVLRILNRTSIGGPVLNAVLLSKFLPSEFETLLVAGSSLDEEQSADFILDEYQIKPHYIKIMKRSINPLQDFFAYKELKKLVKEYKPDIVHTHASKSGGIGRLAAAHCKVPIIIHTFHGHIFHSYFNNFVTKLFILFERYLARKSTKIIAISLSQKNELVNDFKICNEEKIVVIPNGINLTSFNTNVESKRNLWRTRFNVPQNCLLIGIVGRLAPIKNHHMFIDVINEILKNNTNEDIKFVVIGDGDTRTAIQSQLAAYHISYNYFPEDNDTIKSKVLFTSWQTQMDEAYAALDIVCLTSINEGTPITLIEAQASKKPIVTTNVGGVADTILQNESAFLIKPNDVLGFAKALNLLISDKNLRDKMGEAGLSFVNNKYSYTRLVNDMASLYNLLIQEKK